MAASEANSGYGSKFGIGDPPVYVAEVTSITPPPMSRETIDVTHLESDDEYKEYIGSLKDAGEASITVNYKPAASDALQAAFDINESQEFTILFPSGQFKMTFRGIVTGYQIGDLVANDKMSATFTVQATGKAAVTAVTP